MDPDQRGRAEREDGRSPAQQPGAGLPAESGAGEDVLGVLADVEVQLASLRRFHAEREQTQSRQREHEQSLAKREQDLAAQQAAVEQQRTQIQQQQAALRTAQQSLEAQQRQLRELSQRATKETQELQSLQRKHEQDAAAQAATLDQQRAKLQQELDAARRKYEQEAAAQQATLKQERASVQQELDGARRKHEQEAAAQQAAIQQQRSKVEKESGSLQAAQAGLEAQRRELHELTGRASKERGELEGARRKLQEDLERLSAEAARRTAELEDRAAKLQAAAKDADTKTARLQQWADTLAAEREALRALADELTGREAEVARGADHLRELEAQAAQLRAEADAAAQAAAREADRRAKAEAQTAELKAQLAGRGDDQTDKGAILEGLREQAQGLDRLTAEVAARDARIAEQQQELTVAAAKLRDLSLALREQTDQSRQTGDAAGELERRQVLIDELRARVQAAETAKAAATDQPASTEELSRTKSRLEEAAATMEKTSERLRGAEAELEALRGRLRKAKGGAPADAEPDATVSEELWLRRERLRKLKAVLREQSGKVRQASEAIRQRYQQCEQVLSQRGDLVAARQVIAQTQARLAVRTARNKSAALVFYAAAVLGILAGLSWAVVQQVAPATYLARAQIQADPHGQQLAAGDLAEWQRFHEALLTDPALLELAAERMARRGITSLGRAGELQARLQADMTHESPEPGTLVVELRGQGAERTARILETYVTAVMSQANAARDRRTDGAGTVVAGDVRSGSDPVEDHRPLYAAALMGGAILVSVAAGGLLWRRMAASQAAMEHDEAEVLLDASRWPDLGEGRAAGGAGRKAA